VLDLPDVHRGDCDASADIVRIDPVGGLGTAVQNAQLSADELTVVFSRITSVPTQRYGDLYLARRDDFGEAIPLAAPSSELDEFSVSLSDDLLSLYFDRQDVAGIYQIFVATRTTVTDSFGPPAPVPLGDLTDSNFEPYVIADELYFSSTRRDGIPSLFRAAGQGATFGAVEWLMSLESLPVPTAYENPVVTPDGLTLYFGASPDPAMRARDVWTASRGATYKPFDLPRAVSSLDTPSDERPVWVSRDNCRLFVISDSDDGGQAQLRVASRRERE
jgi:hypothetical protein